jgi:hypothetical protein
MNTTRNFYKNVKLGLAMLAVLGLVSVSPVSAFAKGEEPIKNESKLDVSIQQLQDMKFRVALTQPTSSRVFVSIVDAAAGGSLYKGTFTQKDENSRIFDLSQLADGKYVFEVVVGDQKFTQSFELKTQVSRVVLASN